MKETFRFSKENRKNWRGIAIECYGVIKLFLEGFKDFEIEIRNSKNSKSYKQLKGFHRLINILLPYFREWTGEYWDQDKVKDFIKKRHGYTTRFKGVELCKSCKDANIDDMIGLIKEIESFAAEMGIENCYLQSKEQQELNEYYNIKI